VKLNAVMVVDDSVLCTQLMTTLLEPYSSKVVTAASAEEAIERIDENHPIDLVVCDVVMAGKDGFAVLERVRQLTGPRPEVILVTARPTDEGQQRATELGALGYLAKPTTLREILTVLEPPPSDERREQNPRWKCNGTATLCIPESGETGPLVWDVYNISPSGAFLETKGPLVVGSEFDMILELRGQHVRVRARVARVQEPSWLEIGGAGVEFLAPSEETRSAIRRAVEGERPHEALAAIA